MNNELFEKRAGILKLYGECKRRENPRQPPALVKEKRAGCCQMSYFGLMVVKAEV